MNIFFFFFYFFSEVAGIATKFRFCESWVIAEKKQVIAEAR